MSIRISFPMVLAACAAVGAIGYQAGLRSQTVSEGAEDNRARLVQMQSKLQNFTDADFQEYQQLKGRAQQYAKAEELLGKIMMLFLADLGVKVNKADLETVARMAQPLPPHQMPVSASLQSPPASEPTTTSPEPAIDLAQSPNWIEREKNLSEIVNERDAEEFLKRVAVENLFPVVKTARPLDAKMLDTLNGNFQGRIIRDDPQVKSDNVLLELKGFREGESASGTYKINVSSGGKGTSSTKGNGVLQHFKSVEGSNQAVLIRATPNSYMQVYALPRLNQLVGNYYEQIGPDKYSKAGTVILNRR